MLSCAQARKSIKQGCRSFLVLVTQAEIANATLAAADNVFLHLLLLLPKLLLILQQAQHIDALQQQYTYSDVFAEPSGLPPDQRVERVNMSFLC